MNYDALRRLYISGFPDDSEAYADYFFADKIKEAEIFVYPNSEEIISAGYIFVKKLRIFNKTAELPFLVAAATLTEHRGQGIFAYVMKKIFSAYKNCPFIALYPARRGYYRRAYGFTDYNRLPKGPKILNELSESFAFSAFSPLKASKIYGKKAGKYDSCIVREPLDFEKKHREALADGGGAAILTALKDGRAAGYVFYDCFKNVSECCIDSADYNSFGRDMCPAMMIRIINAEAALDFSGGPLDIFYLNDGFWPENRGFYSGGKKMGYVSADSSKIPDLSSEKLQDIMFGGDGIFMPEYGFSGLSAFSLEQY